MGDQLHELNARAELAEIKEIKDLHGDIPHGTVEQTPRITR